MNLLVWTMVKKMSQSSKILPSSRCRSWTKQIKCRQREAIFHLEVGQPSSPPGQLCLKRVAWPYCATWLFRRNGQPRLRQRIAAHYRDGIKYLQIGKRLHNTWFLTGFVIAFLSAFNKGDRIAIASPGYPAYFNSMLALGITPQLLPARADEN